MQTTLEYPVLLDEIDALEAILPKITLAMDRGARWLCSQMAPRGPIMAAEDLGICYKTVWALYEAGRSPEAVRLLDWIDANAKQAPGEYYFPGEHPFQRDSIRIYRPLTFGRIAEYLKHPAYANDAVRQRILAYQHPCGGVFANLDPKPAALEVLNTSFFGHWALAAGLHGPARRAGDFIADTVQMNQAHLCEDPPRFYFRRDPDSGRLLTDIPPGETINCRIDDRTIKQSSWVSGACVAILSDLYAAFGEERYLRLALRLADYDLNCSPAQLFWPSKCKVGWGAAQLYQIGRAHV